MEEIATSELPMTSHEFEDVTTVANAEDDVDKLILMDKHTATILIVAIWVVASGIISILGVIGNTVNIAVFIKMGMKDTMNISLLGLAIADLCSSILLICIGQFYTPYMKNPDFTFIASEVEYLAFGWPRVYFCRCISGITAFVAFERCLCITIPLKVKALITPRRSFYVITSIYIIMALSVLPTFISSWLGYKFDEERNKTVLGLILHEDRQTIDGIAFFIGVVLTSSTFILAFICAIILLFNLKRQTFPGQKSTTTDSTSGGGGSNAIFNKEARTAKSKQAGKMVLIITVVFVFCYIPSNMLQMTMALLSDFNKGGYYINLRQVCWAIANALEAVNSSVNIFMYLRMSSKYKTAFSTIFPRCASLIGIKVQ